MRILFLGKRDSPLIEFLKNDGCHITQTDKPLLIPPPHRDDDWDFIISYRYRHKVSYGICRLYDGRAINLHPSFLPYNRGADPVFWSLVEGTPHGVTIHKLAPEIDTGDILVQARLPKHPGGFRRLYEEAYEALEAMFKHNWAHIKAGRLKPVEQNHINHTYHTTKDTRMYLMERAVK